MRRLLVAVVVGMVGMVGTAAVARADTFSYAIVIGNNAVPAEAEGQGLRPLRYADDDAVRYYQLMSRVADAELLAVLDPTTQRRYPRLAGRTRPPTLDNLRRAVSRVADAIAARRAQGHDAVAYVVFSGHGALAADGAPFLALADAPLTQRALYDDVLARLPATYVHLIIDACHAGGVVGVRGGFFGEELDGQTRTIAADELAQVVRERSIERFPHVGVMLSASLGQEAHEWSEVESGVFTHELLSGLLGPADVNGDLAIEYSEAHAYVAAANRDLRDPRAMPQVVVRPPRANARAPLIDLAGVPRVRFLTGATTGLGRFHIELSDGQRYLDAHLARDAAITIALPASQRAFLRTATREAAIPDRGAVSIAALTWSDTHSTARGSLGETYRNDLFASPYGQSYYRGFVDSIGGASVSFGPDAEVLSLPEHPRTSPPRWRSIAVLSAAGAIAVGSVVTGALAYDARGDFERTDLQRAAHEASDRFDRYAAVSITAGVTAAVLGGLGWWLWPDDPAALTIRAEAGDGTHLGLDLAWTW